MDIPCATAITAVALGLTAMFLGYKMKMDRKSIKLEKNDKQHEQKHNSNCRRIEKLEEKNGNEQHQIDELKEQNKMLSQRVEKLTDVIINGKS
jgi:uncharacterized protein HemX